MEEKITLNLFYMGLIAAILAVFCSGLTFYDAYQVQVQEDLQQQGQLVAAACETLSDPADLSRFSGSGLRITLIQADGTVLFESETDPVSMENHLDRPEVQQALSSGSGSDRRTSNTLGTEDYYYATRLASGDILRVSQAVSNIYQIYGRAVPYLVAAICVLMVLAVIFAVVLTRRLLVPIKRLPDELDDPNLAQDRTRVYPELQPFVLEIQKQRREREGMRQEFTANVSHELKTPLTTISGYAEMIETGMAREEDVKRFAATIRKESGRLLSLISDIIRLSQLDENESPAPMTPVDLRNLASECMDSLIPAAKKQNISFSVEGTECTVSGDQGELWELVYNLIDNAIRYNRPGGSVKVLLSDHEITVQDTGIGIPPEHQDRIFERFYRVDKSHSRSTGGTGLGLSIVKHVAEHHGAKIHLKSTLGVGTAITVSFPRDEA